MTSEGGIFLLNDAGDLVELHEQPYESEGILQELLERHPSLLAGQQISPVEPRRWVLVAREMGLASQETGATRWYVDHLLLDQDGIPTLVEVKRSSDSRIRREVVGQMLDYAANAVLYWPVEDIRGSFESSSHKTGKEPAAILTELSGIDDEEGFWQLVKTNLVAGRIRMLFVADVIPTELRRIVEFLNEQMRSAEVLAVEIRQYAGQGMRTLVPRVYGQTTTAEQAKATSVSPLVRGSADFRAFIEQAPAENQAELRRLTDWAEELEKRGITDLHTRHDKRGWRILLLRLKDENVALASIWNDGKASLNVYEPVLARRAPSSIEPLKAAFAPKALSNSVYEFSGELLQAVEGALREVQQRGKSV